LSKIWFYLCFSPNDETYRAMDNLENNREVEIYHSKDDLFKDLGL